VSVVIARRGLGVVPSLAGNVVHRPGESFYLVKEPVLLFFQLFDDGTEVYGAVGEPLVFCDFRPVQHFETVTFEQLEAAPAVEGDDLGVDLLHAGLVKECEVSFEQLPADLDAACSRQDVEVKMPD
jgi:hypothetical protein